MDREPPSKKRGLGGISNIQEDIEFVQFKELYEALKRKYGLSSPEIMNLVEREEILVPVCIYTEDLGSLEIVVKYLKENLKLGNNEISRSIGRDSKSVWQAYNKSKIKHPDLFIVDSCEHYFPASILQDKRYSVLGSIVVYLKDNFNLSYHEIAVLLKRDDRTIWTTYQREIKHEKKKEKQE